MLLVEDSGADVFLMQEAFEEVSPQVRLHLASDGVEALAFLRRQGEFADAPRPDLVLLDLNLPRKSGLEVLAEVRGDAGLCALPVMVLSTSDARHDVKRAYELGVNAYMLKPRDLAGFFERVRLIEQFWLSAVRLPDR
ncbi:response regulator (plasmid) [Deinococcus metallilatus]|nr:response regulator [Deinococcus metallilatus]